MDISYIKVCRTITSVNGLVVKFVVASRLSGTHRLDEPGVRFPLNAKFISFLIPSHLINPRY